MKTINQIYETYSAKDYWGYKDAYRGRPEFTDEIKKQMEKEGFDWTVNNIQSMIKNKDTEQLKSRIRYDQPLSIKIYEAITKEKLPKTNIKLRQYFNSKY